MTNSPASGAVSRRDFLAASSGLIVAAVLPLRTRAQGAPSDFEPNAFIRIAPDNIVTVFVKHIEFGQGPFTGLATLVAEELDADWSQMRAEAAPADVKLYANALFGVQGTGGSTAIASSYEPMRKAGAAAKAMLVAAAAEAWDAPVNEIAVTKGVIRHAASGREGQFGDFAEAAAAQTPPENPALKTRDQFKLIGTSLPKLDSSAKSDGSATFTLDVYRDNMLTAVVAHPDKFGAVVGAFDDAAARAVPGVVDVRKTGRGIAVYGENTFAALRGRAALDITWDDSGAETRSTAALAQDFIAAVQKPGAVAAARGDIDSAFDEKTVGDATILEAEYVFPFLAHAPMEPLDGVIEQRGEEVEVWMGSQIQTTDHQVLAGVLGVEPAAITLNTMLAGGSFGRRAQPSSEFAAELADVFKATDRSRPVKFLWTREDDIRGGFYRPLTVHKLKAAITPGGEITAWDQTIASQSVVVGSPFEAMIENGIDSTMVEGARDFYYKAANLRVSAHIMPSKVPVLWWRSVGHTHTAYAIETFIDELLAAADKDPVEGRLALLQDERAREAAVLKRVADMMDWGRAPTPGAQFGVAVHKSFNTYVAEIAEVANEGSTPRVLNVWAAVDCGQPVNPNVIKAQIEGGVGYGLGAMMFNEITLGEGGAVEQSNFHDYRSIRIGEMPNIDVAVIDSSEAPTGVGEPGVPPAAPAVGNALRRLTGATPRRLPLMSPMA